MRPKKRNLHELLNTEIAKSGIIRLTFGYIAINCDDQLVVWLISKLVS